jgi:hypothetical protein
VIRADQTTARSAGLIDSGAPKPHSEENMMTKSSVVAAILLSLAIGSGPAWAQDQPAAKPAKTEMSAEKKAISKACSDQANAKGLHGKERKKFRAECKRKGGKPE